jgi:catechol 2,3-dioxygenase-like lactoylglutathione lyase family enzyme
MKSEIVQTASWRSNMHPNTEGILESSLYVTDLARSVSFYKKIFGFEVISDFGERGCVMKAGNCHVLLLFKKGGSLNIVSPHDGDGELHLAFAIGGRRTDTLGSVACRKQNPCGRDASLEAWWSQPLFP